ncbi:MAG: phospholipase D family protein [Dehalococcoidales bacterium]|nr:phospholipase D family protein [Dehalococcoidales bacterium]
MAEFLTTQATAYNIENIILHSKQKLVLISPYLQLSKNFFGRLNDADGRGIETVIVYGKDELKPNERTRLSKLKNLSLFFCENLHAKCYFNEDEMVITSMNMYEFSEKNNREMGVLIKRQDEPEIFKEAMREVQSIVKASIKEDRSYEFSQQPARTSVRDKIPTPTYNAGKPSFSNILKGTLSSILTGEKLDAYCIRCHDRIPIDSFHPLCDECYWVWAEYGNSDYSEHWCHYCGRESKTTKDKPLCSSCFNMVRNR